MKLEGIRRALPALALRPLHVALYAAVAGLLLGPRVPWLAGILAAVLGTAALWIHPRPGADPLDLAAAQAAMLRRAARIALAAGAIALVLGAVAGNLRLDALERTHLAPELGHLLTEEPVELREAPRAAPFGGWSAVVRLRGEPVLLRIPDAQEPFPDVGTRLAVTGGLRPAGEFAALRHAHAELRAERVAPRGSRGGFAGMVDGVRRRAELSLDRGLPPSAAGLFRGMVLGEDGAMPEATRDDFRAAGLSHLVAASGTNVVLLAALAAGLGTALGLGLSARLWLVAGLIVLYVPLAGGGPSIQRAGIMGAAAVAAGLAGRPASRWYALGLAGVVTLALDPRAAAAPGWQLSFVAVVSLLVLAPRWSAALVDHGVPRALAEVMAMTGAATLSTAPVIAIHFGQASLVGLPANLLAAPVVGPIMWLGVLAAGVGQLAALGPVFAAAAGPVLDGTCALAGFPLGYLTWIGTTAAATPGAVLELGVLPVALASVAITAVLCSRRVRRILPASAVVAVVGWLAFAPARAARPRAPAGFRLTFLDIGQGDATLLQEGGRTVLVDTGPPDGGVVERLRRAGVGRIDLLVGSHAQLDHIGAAAAVLDAMPVGAVLDGRDGVREASGDALEAAARTHGVRLIPGRAGQVLRLGRLRLRVLWPPVRAPGPAVAGTDPNDRAIVLQAEADGARALLAADAESDVLSRLDLGPVDLLKVSHHGSADPGLVPLLRRLRPRVAGIEVGAGNSYGHPAPSTLAALVTVPAVVRTDRDGSVRIERGRDGAWELRREP